MFEVAAILLGLLALVLVVWPLTSSVRANGSDTPATDFFRRQLEEVDARLAGQTNPDPVLKEERAEIARRLIRAAREEQGSKTGTLLGRRGLFASALVISVVSVGLASSLYARFGSPQMPDVPLALQKQQDIRDLPVENLLARAEEHLRSNPDDLRGWQVVEPVYGRLQRYEDQERALLQIVRLDGETADRLAQLARLSALNNGSVVTKRANDLLERALQMEPDNETALFFSSMAREQEGRNEEAVALLNRLLAKADAQSELAPMIRDRIARLGGSVTVPPPDGDAAAGIRALPQKEQEMAIRGMVERLAARLEAGDDDVSSWPRLINAYLVLGELESAGAALEKARLAAADDPTVTGQLEALQRRLEEAAEGEGENSK